MIFLFLPIQARAPFASVPVMGHSMEPTIKSGTLVFIHKVSNYKKGDIVAFNDQKDQRIVLHRVIGFSQGRVITRGDNNPVDDYYSPFPNDIYGRMYLDIPAVGAWSAQTQRPVIFLGCIVLLFLALLAGWAKGRRGSPQLLD